MKAFSCSDNDHVTVTATRKDRVQHLLSISAPPIAGMLAWIWGVDTFGFSVAAILIFTLIGAALNAWGVLARTFRSATLRTDGTMLVSYWIERDCCEFNLRTAKVREISNSRGYWIVISFDTRKIVIFADDLRGESLQPLRTRIDELGCI